MKAIWRACVRTIFWSYERGSWPYDVAVVVIVIFVLATPTRWFHDRPSEKLSASSAVQLVTEDASSRTATYRVNASALPPEKRTARPPELERELHQILGNAVPTLKDTLFEVVRIDAVLAADGSTQAYDVSVRQGFTR
jgi:hypothetical protein